MPSSPPSSARPHAPAPRGLLRSLLPRGAGETTHARLLPSAALAPHVAHFWTVAWDLETPFTTETLAHPSVHVVFEARAGHPSAQVAGVPTTRFTRELTGRGDVFGVKFRPAMFQPLLGASMATLTGRVVPIADVFGREGDALGAAILAASSIDRKIELAEAFFTPRVAPVDRALEALRDLVEAVAADPTVLRVGVASAPAGVSARALQRQFQRYVGVSPKWVIQRFRLHEAAERLKGEPPPPLALLASALGYADQAHFARDFKRMIGRTPRAFARMERAGRDGRHEPAHGSVPRTTLAR